jgi:tRNA G18 (ribose-2'-O)-methylase SpoU
MTRIPIHDLDDPRLAHYRHLKATNATRNSGLFVVEGEKLLHDLLASPFPTASVLVTDRREADIAPIVPEGVPLYVLPQPLVSELVGYNFHQGVLACGTKRSWPGLDAILDAAGPRSTLVLCPRIDNPENLGAIVRLADVFDVAAVLVGGRCPDPLSRRVLRVSMGTVLRRPVLSWDDLAPVARSLQQSGVSLAATVVDPDAVSLNSYRRPDRLGLVLGCEGNGLPADWVALCDTRLTIPMRPEAESLNVAVAAGILLYHLTTGLGSGQAGP